VPGVLIRHADPTRDGTACAAVYSPYRGIGFKHGEWLSVGWFQATLREQTPGETPADPGAPARLDGRASPDDLPRAAGGVPA
jgi:hypothetical protein